MKDSNRWRLRSIHQQRGWTFWSMMFVMSVVLLAAYIGMQLVPIYASNAAIVKAMEKSLEGENLRTINRSVVVRKMTDQLYLDGTHEILDFKSDMKVRRSRNQLVLETHYQREVPLFMNLSLLARFDNIVERKL